MTIDKATKQLLESEEFKASAKVLTNSKLRVYLSRYKNGTLSECGCIELLKNFGYEIEVKKPRKGT
jgi:hypothetical protein